MVLLALPILIIILVSYLSSGSGSTKPSSQENTFPQSTIHTHVWSPATYERPEYCLDCGAEQGDPLGYLGTIRGEFGDATVNGQSCGMITLNTPISGMRSMTVNLTVEILSGNPLEYWECYFWDDTDWVYLGSIYLTGGAGTTTCTFTGDGTQYIDRLAFLPALNGQCHYGWGVHLSDVSQTQ